MVDVALWLINVLKSADLLGTLAEYDLRTELKVGGISQRKDSELVLS